MKRLYFTLLLFMFSLTATINAQVEVGIIGGLNFTDITQKNIGVQSIKGETKFAVGAVADFILFNNFSLRVEPMYITKGATLTSNDTNPADFSLKLSYFELPVLFKYSIGNEIKPYIMAGAILSYNTASSMETEISGVTFSGDAADIIKDFEYSLSFGAGASYNIGAAFLFVEARYTFGMSDVVGSGEYVLSNNSITITDPVEDNVEVKNKGLQILTGITIPLNF